MRVMDKLLDRLRNLMAESVVRTWVELLRGSKKEGPLHISNNLACDVADAVGSVMEELSADAPVVLHCAMGLETLAARCPALGGNVWKVLLAAMGRSESSPAVRAACGESLLHTQRTCKVVLGLAVGACAAPTPEVREGLRVEAAALSAAGHGQLAHRLMACGLDFPTILGLLGPEDSLNDVLDEVFRGLPLASLWSNYDDPQVRENRQLLCKVAAQAMLAEDLDAQGTSRRAFAWEMDTTATWVEPAPNSDRHEVERRQRLEHRLILAGLLARGDTVTEPLFSAMSAVALSGNWDEEFLAPALRALAGLKDLGLCEPVLAQDVVRHMVEGRFKPWAKHCHSAWVGVLGAFTGELLCTDVGLVNSAVRIIVEGIGWWLPLYNTDGVIHESLWALNAIFEHAASRAPDLAARWADRCCAAAQQVLDKDYYRRFDAQDPTFEASLVKREAGKLIDTLSPAGTPAPHSAG